MIIQITINLKENVVNLKRLVLKNSFEKQCNLHEKIKKE